jgi:hypothetical protein
MLNCKKKTDGMHLKAEIHIYEDNKPWSLSFVRGSTQSSKQELFDTSWKKHHCVDHLRFRMYLLYFYRWIIYMEITLVVLV